jgi:ATP-dependent DNA helicase PIF1
MASAPGKQILYQEMPQQYTWNSSERTWKPRKRDLGKVIGRMYHVNLTAGEHFYFAAVARGILQSESFSGEAKVCRSVDSLHEPGENAGLYPVEFLNSITPSGLPHHELKVKLGTPVMLIRNLNVAAGLANGTRLSVVRMHRFFLECRIVNGSHAGNIVFIPRITLLSTESELPFTVKRLQFPIRLAFAMTINKSQGQSLDSVGIYLKNPVFSHGQLYVAFSRASSFTAVRIMGAKKRGNKFYTVNIVYGEIIK